MTALWPEVKLPFYESLFLVGYLAFVCYKTSQKKAKYFVSILFPLSNGHQKGKEKKSLIFCSFYRATENDKKMLLIYLPEGKLCHEFDKFYQ